MKALRVRAKRVHDLQSRKLPAKPEQNYDTKSMFRAIRCNRLLLVIMCLKSGNVDLEAREATHPGNGYLHLAAHLGSVAILKLLLRAGCRVDATNSKGFTPLHLVLQKHFMMLKHRLIIVKSLLDYGSNVNATDSCGDTPLHTMAQSNNCKWKIVELLLQHGADLRRVNKEGRMPFHEYIFAQETSSYGVNQATLKQLLPDNELHDIMSPMHEACVFHQLDTVKELVKEGAEVDLQDKFGRSPLYYAVISRRTDELEWIEPNEPNEDKISIVRLLLDYGADLNQNYAENRYSIDKLVVELAFNMREQDIFLTFLEYAAKTLATLSNTSNEYRLMYFHYFKYMQIEHFEVSTQRAVVELNLMKTSMLQGSISFYQLLEAESDESMVYAKNKETVRIFEASGYETRFPMYHGMLRASLDRGFVRLKLVEEASDILSDAMQFAYPSHPGIEKIVSYLCDEELKYLVDCDKNENIHTQNYSCNLASYNFCVDMQDI